MVFFIVLITVLAIFARVSNNKVGVAIEQPVAFAHNLHAGQLGISCAYCHASVETSAVAGVPPTETCMACHSQIRVGTEQLAAVQKSWDTNIPIEWNKVTDLADFVYFNHAIHVNKGVGCAECHGRVDQMEVVFKAEPLTMGWCLECHRAPEKFLRPREEVFNMAYEKPANQLELGQNLVEEYHINLDKLISCSVCHR